MIVVGIDPGLRGAICRMHGDDVRVWDIPTVAVKRNGKVRSSIDREALATLIGLEVLGDFCEPSDATCFVEWAQASPQMGVSSAFQYGMGFGLVLGVLSHLGVPATLVTAAKWKRYMGLATKGNSDFAPSDKSLAMHKALELYPRLRTEIYLAKHEGRAEAVLLTHYGCEQLEGVEKRPMPLADLPF